jgi:hypothetical protein
MGRGKEAVVMSKTEKPLGEIVLRTRYRKWYWDEKPHTLKAYEIVNGYVVDESELHGDDNNERAATKRAAHREYQALLDEVRAHP